MKGRELVEVVADIEEFKEILDPASRIHYRILSKPGALHRGVALEWIAGLEIYGITKEGWIAKLVLADVIKMEEVKEGKDLYDGYNIWAQRTIERLIKEAREKLGKITLGYYEVIKVKEGSM